MKYQVWCATVVSVVSGCIRSFLSNSTQNSTHAWLAWQRHELTLLSLSRPPPWLLAPQLPFQKGEVPTTLTFNQKVQLTARRNRLPTVKDSKDPDPKNHRKIFVLLNLWDSEGFFSQPKSQTPITMTISDESHWSIPRKLYKEMKSRCRAIKLCKTLYLWRDDRYRSSTNQSWITRDRCTAVKSFN